MFSRLSLLNGILTQLNYHKSVMCIFFGSMDKNSLEKLREASAAEAEAANAVWQAAQAASANPADETSVSDDNSQAAETISDGSDTEADVRLHPRAVCLFHLYHMSWGLSARL